jgi:hypothetical protein
VIVESELSSSEGEKEELKRAQRRSRDRKKRLEESRRAMMDSSSSEERIVQKKKKRKRAQSSDSSDYVKEKLKKREKKRKTSESSTDGEPMVVDNWTKLALLWPVEQRPPFLRHRATVNSHTMKELMAMEKLYRGQAWKMGKADRLFTKDSGLPMTKVKGGKDDRATRFHESSFFRLPIVEPEEYYEEVPVSREPVYRHIPLKHCGAENAVNELVVVRMHDRGTPVTLKMFHGKNYAKRPGTEAVTLDGGWEAPLKMRFIQEALNNHAVVSRSLWPMDQTPDVIQRVLIRNYWGGIGETDAMKATLITDFFGDLMTENASRATKRKEPADHRRAKELWTEVCEKHGVAVGGTSGVQTKAAGGSGGVGGGSGGGGNGGNAGKQKQQTKQWDGKGATGGGAGRFQPSMSGRTAAKVGSIFVCHRYNEPLGCGRPKQGQGCKGWNGQIFAHNCNATKANGEYCLEVHPKKDHN